MNMNDSHRYRGTKFIRRIKLLLVLDDVVADSAVVAATMLQVIIVHPIGHSRRLKYKRY